MALARRTFSPAEELSLTTQVGGFCPLCGKHLFNRKKSRDFKSYELAHIYPLNPTLIEIGTLRNVERLSNDPNHLDNLIPLCTTCHENFDKPRTVEEYEQLVKIKQQAIRDEEQRKLFLQYQLETDIEAVIARLGDINFDDSAADVDISLDPKSIETKLDESMPGTTRRKIKHMVADYYQHIHREFRNLEMSSPEKSQLIYIQVRAFYMKQKTLGLSQPEIFRNVVNWFRSRTSPQTEEAPEIVAAFFVQNCEVFD